MLIWQESKVFSWAEIVFLSFLNPWGEEWVRI
jgi:hypothetical protein